MSCFDNGTKTNLRFFFSKFPILYLFACIIIQIDLLFTISDNIWICGVKSDIYKKFLDCENENVLMRYHKTKVGKIFVNPSFKSNNFHKNIRIIKKYIFNEFIPDIHNLIFLFCGDKNSLKFSLIVNTRLNSLQLVGTPVYNGQNHYFTIQWE